MAERWSFRDMHCTRGSPAQTSRGCNRYCNKHTHTREACDAVGGLELEPRFANTCRAGTARSPRRARVQRTRAALLQDFYREAGDTRVCSGWAHNHAFPVHVYKPSLIQLLLEELLGKLLEELLGLNPPPPPPPSFNVQRLVFFLSPSI
jgi:hypothetical protein